MSDEHQSFIKSPRQLIAVVILAFLVPIVVITLIATFVQTTKRTGSGADTMTPEAIARRLQPVGVLEVVDANAPKTLRSGEEVYKTVCSACHETGVAGAPKVGDKAAWAPRIKTGLDALVHSALKGKGAMPPQGGGQFDDTEIARAVVFLANKGGAKFEEPQVAQGEAKGANGQAGATPAAGTTPAAAATAAAPSAAPAAAAPASAASAPAASAPAASAPTASATAASAPAASGGESAPKPAGTGDVAAGEKVYKGTCGVCHETGVAGAPKHGDKAAWKPRLDQGFDVLVKHSIEGIRAMPPRGGNGKLTDEQLRDAVAYMIAAVQ